MQAVIEPKTINYSQNIELPTSIEEVPLPAKGCCKRTGMFVGYAVHDASRNKCHFFLAFCSVFVVVLSILVVNTIVSVGPLVFLSLGQK